MQFGIKFLLVVTALFALCLAAYQSQWLFLTVVCVLAANLLGLAIGWLVTNVFRFPTDGGYRDSEIREEFGQDDAFAPEEKSAK